jgi:hypothetical protein
MDRVGQRLILKYFFLKGYASKLIHQELVSTLQDNVISLSIAKNWLTIFKSGELFCGNEERPGRPLISLGPGLQRFLKKFPFASVQAVAGHFSVDRAAIKSILDRELSLTKFARKWVPYILLTEQKLRRVTESQSGLTIPANLAEKNWEGIITGDESRFAYLIESDAMFALSPAEVTPRVRP